MAHPYLDGLYIVVCAQRNPRFTEFAQHPLAVKLSDVGVVRKYNAALITSMGIFAGARIYQDIR